MSEVDKLLSEVVKLEKVIKKAVAELKKKPGDSKLADAVRKAMLDVKKLEGDYPKAAAADKAVFDKAIKGLSGG